MFRKSIHLFSQSILFLLFDTPLPLPPNFNSYDKYQSSVFFPEFISATTSVQNIFLFDKILEVDWPILAIFFAVLKIVGQASALFSLFLCLLQIFVP